MSYDRADHDYSTEAEPLPKGHAATHIGMFLGWAIQRGLENGYHQQKSGALLEKVRQRNMTGCQFFEAVCDGKFSERELNAEGNAFAEYYYANSAGQRGMYFDDYRKVLTAKLPSFWHVSDTWENFDKVSQVIEQRYQAWKNPRKKRWWQFWKK